MMRKTKHLSPGGIASCIILSAILIRFIALGLFPLQDTSEARYGEMVRLMVETNDWITPYFDYDVPFWGKPPLFIWMSALSMKVFGVNEFAVRFPALLCGILVMGLCWQLAQFQLGRIQAKLAVLILVSTAMFLVLSGTVLADPVMLLSITLIMTGFWIGWHSPDQREKRLWQYLFFAGCGIALLSKGPVVLVIAGLPIFFWCLPKGRLLQFWQTFPCIIGVLLTLLVALPWYIAAELKTPGFLEYFVVGEHFSRYVDSGWDGDQYGSAHIKPLGTIWIRWIQGGAPWSVVIVFIALKRCWHRVRGAKTGVSSWEGFLWLWLLTPLLFFTFSKNLIWTYALPVAPAMALLLTTRWETFWQQQPLRILATATLVPILMLGAAIAFSMDVGKPSQKTLINTIKDVQTEYSGHIVYWQKRPFSARYYSEGKALLFQETKSLREALNNKQQNFLITNERAFKGLPEDIQQRFKELKRYRNWVLWQESGF